VDAGKKRALEWPRFAKNDLAVATHLNEVFRPLPENWKKLDNQIKNLLTTGGG